jgi:hypothetical protein
VLLSYLVSLGLHVLYSLVEKRNLVIFGLDDFEGLFLFLGLGAFEFNDAFLEGRDLFVVLNNAGVVEGRQLDFFAPGCELERAQAFLVVAH